MLFWYKRYAFGGLHSGTFIIKDQLCEARSASSFKLRVSFNMQQYVNKAKNLEPYASLYHVVYDDS